MKMKKIVLRKIRQSEIVGLLIFLFCGLAFWWWKSEADRKAALNNSKTGAADWLKSWEAAQPVATTANGPTPPSAVVPVAPSGVAAGATTTSSVQMNWNAVPNAMSYIVERSNNSTGPFSNVGTPNTTTYTDNNLSAGQTYYYRIVAVNGTTQSLPSSPAVAVATNAAAIPVPDKTTGLTATALASPSRIALGWTANTTGAVPTGYRVERSTNQTDWTLETTTTSTTYSNNSLTPGVVYYYRVIAVNQTGSAAPSDVVSATATTVVPSKVLGLTSTASDTFIALNWAANNTGATPTGYVVERSENQSLWSIIVNLDSSNTSHNDLSVTPGITYYYRVMALNQAGEGAPSDVANATIAVSGLGAYMVEAENCELTQNGPGPVNSTEVNLGNVSEFGQYQTPVMQAKTYTLTVWHRGDSSVTAMGLVVDGTAQPNIPISGNSFNGFVSSSTPLVLSAGAHTIKFTGHPSGFILFDRWSLS